MWRAMRPTWPFWIVMLPDMDGFTLCRTIREAHLFPIIMLTARVEDMDKIMGLTLGADDYITKPFNPLELVARVKTQLRRYIRYNHGEAAPKTPQEYDLRGLTISKINHKCTLYGEELALTPLEFSILWYLCEHRGQVVSSEELFEAVWGEKYMDSNNTVMSHIARLREKMHEPSRRPKFVKTVWGVGYTLNSPLNKLKETIARLRAGHNSRSPLYGRSAGSTLGLYLLCMAGVVLATFLIFLLGYNIYSALRDHATYYYYDFITPFIVLPLFSLMRGVRDMALLFVVCCWAPAGWV